MSNKKEQMKVHKAEFIEAFKDVDEEKINKALDGLASNQIEGDEDNEARQSIYWKDCPLEVTAGYYANHKVNDDGVAVPEIDELKALLNE